jgi:hypothetical protein
LPEASLKDLDTEGTEFRRVSPSFAEFTEKTRARDTRNCAARTKFSWEQQFHQKVSNGARRTDACNRRTPRPLNLSRQSSHDAKEEYAPSDRALGDLRDLSVNAVSDL